MYIVLFDDIVYSLKRKPAPGLQYIALDSKLKLSLQLSCLRGRCMGGHGNAHALNNYSS